MFEKKGGEFFLIGCHVSPYSHSPVDAHEPLREKKLLLHRDEIISLMNSVQRKGQTIVPLKLYLKKSRCKLEIATARGKKLHDKRQDVKKREADRHIERVLKRQK